MPLPKGLLVGARRYTVICSQAGIDSESVERGEELHGVTNTSTMRVTLNPKNSADRQRDTLLHEALHTVLDLVGLNQDLGAEMEERVVNRLAPALLDLLRRNPRLVDYLMEK